ncbi:MAG TPA: ABC transporter permease, partial [Humisphaera sp.]
MTPFRLILRNLFHFRAASLAVVAGMAVGTAVLAGSLMVGDSVRGSLRSLAVERLGPVDYVLVSNRFFKSGGDDGLAERVAKSANVTGRFDVAPAIVASGSAVATKDDVRQPPVGDVQVIGFGTPAGGAAITGWPAVAREAVVLNAQAAGELGFAGKSAASIEFQLPSKEDAARDATIARRSREDTAATLEARSVADVVPDRGLLGLFNLQGSQRTPKNAWVNLADLQAAVKQPGRANALLVHDRKLDLALAGPDAAGEAAASTAALNDAVRAVVTLADYGLEVEKSKATGELSVWTKGTYLDPPIVAAAREAAKKVGTELQLVTVNLVNKVEVTDEQGKPAEGVRPLHYAIGAGVSRLGGRPIKPDEIVFNEATAKQMSVRPGQRVTLRYFRRDADGHLTDVGSAAAGMTFVVGEPVPMTGIGADPELTPRFTGVTHANNGRPIRSVGEWKLPADMAAVMGPAGRKLAEDDNREYWGDEAKGKKGYGPAPRMFIHVDAARKLWAGPYGDLTSVRVPAEKAAAFETVLRTTIDPAALGLTFQPIKQKQLEASAGSTDFSGLFVGFSFFLIAAAALLVAMLFRLNVEQRVRQFGVLAAVGFSPTRVRWMALAEGAVLAIVGGAVGVGLGVLYTWAMVYGLRTWWVGAIGTTNLELHVTGKTLWMGFIFGFWVALMAVLWAVWRLGKVTPARLVAGQLSAAPRGVKKTDGRLPRLAGVGLAIAGAAVLGVAMAGKIKPEVALGGGAVLLAAG